MENFRINAKSFFLTYPQSALSKERLCDFFQSIKPCYEIEIGEESHENGGKHFHAIVTFKTKYDCRNCRAFDCDGEHPSIEAVKKLAAARNYISKEDQDVFIWHEHGGTWDPYEAAGRAESRTEFMRECHLHGVPFSYATDAWRCASDTGGSVPEPVGTIRSEPLVMLGAIPGYLESHSKSHVILGPSGVGKTTFAIKHAPKPFLLVSHMDQLKNLTKRHKSIIFDDMDFTHMPRHAQIHLVDTMIERAIHVRYGIAVIPTGIVKVFTCNVYPFVHDEAISNRVNLIKA